jgi:hypothetical protein
MDEHRQDSPLTDEEVDRAIGELLDVEPSPDFVARVRTRIDGERIAPRWFDWRLVPVSAAIASLLVIVVVWSAGKNGEPPPQPQAVSVAPAPPEPAKPTAVTPQAVNAGTAAVAAPGRNEPNEAPPAVLVSRAEVEGLRYFVSALREGRLDANALPSESGDLEEPMPIVIEPITVEPLLSAGDTQSGELQ